MSGEQYRITDDVDGLLETIASDALPVDVMAHAISRCAEREPSDVWNAIADLPFSTEADEAVAWFDELLTTEPPDSSVTGFWFGIFLPVDRGLDFYVSGSRSWPGEEWIGDVDWWPVGRYRRSGVLRDLRALTVATGNGTVKFFAEYFLAMAFTGATVANVLKKSSPERTLGLVDARGIAFGHDSGDFFDLAEIRRAGFVWSLDPS